MLIEMATRKSTPIPFDLPVLLIETGVAHRLAESEYNRRRAECDAALDACRGAGTESLELAGVPGSALGRLESRMPPVLFRRLRHVVTEAARTRAAAASLREGQFERVGRHMLEGHHSIRDDFESSCGEADRIVESATRHGAWGARLTGAGWGGTVLAIAPAEQLEALAKAVSADYRREVGHTPRVWRARASSGVRSERPA